MSRDTYYHFKQGGRIAYSGITTDLNKREQEHKRHFGEDGHIKRWEAGRPARPALGKRADETRGMSGILKTA